MAGRKEGKEEERKEGRKERNDHGKKVGEKDETFVISNKNVCLRSLRMINFIKYDSCPQLFRVFLSYIRT
jgi:hypothetical protein